MRASAGFKSRSGSADSSWTTRTPAAVRKLLLLAYFFPPIGGAGAQRNTKLARYLPEFDWELSVVTGPGLPEYHWTPIDNTLLEEIPADVRVCRVPGPEPAFSRGWRDRAERWLVVESPWQRWWDEHAVSTALEVGHDVDLVYASLAPYNTAEAAVAIADALGKPLVVDLEDPWAFDEMTIYPSALHRRLDLHRMRKTLASADGVVMNTPEAASRVLRRFSTLEEAFVTAIPNGYDAADFSGPPPDADGKVRIVHAGSLHTDFAFRHKRLRPLRAVLQGAASGVDPLTRSHVFLLEAIRQLLREQPEISERVELHLVGTLTDEDREVVGDAHFVVEHGFVNHRETIDLIRSATLLFLPMHDLAEGRRVAIVPCKTYEYLASGRPILAAVPDGDARDLLAEAGNACLTRPSDVAGMKQAIEDALSRAELGLEAAPPRKAVLDRLDRRRLTADLVAFLDRVIATRRAR